MKEISTRTAIVIIVIAVIVVAAAVYYFLMRPKGPAGPDLAQEAQYLQEMAQRTQPEAPGGASMQEGGE